MRLVLSCLLLVLAVAGADAAVDLNSASQTELETVPGIGPGRARAILEYRKAHGGFRHVDELDHIRGIGAKGLARMRPQLSIGSPPPKPSSTSDASVRTVRSPPTPRASASPRHYTGSAGQGAVRGGIMRGPVSPSPLQ